MSLDENAVRAALAKVIEPETGRDLDALKMVKSVAVEGGLVNVAIELFTPAYAHWAKLDEAIRAASQQAGAVGVKVDYAVNVVRRSNRPNEGGRLPGVKNVIAVAAGKGGVGKSTVAT